METIYEVQEAIGNYSNVIAEFYYIEDAHEFVMHEAIKAVEETTDLIKNDKEFEDELQNQLSYFAIVEKDI